jgi:hypothetical protein
MRVHHALRPASAVLAGVALLFLTSCGSSYTTGSTATTSPAAPATTATPRPGCADVAALRSSLEALTKVNPLQDGLTSLNAAIADVQSKLNAARASAGMDLQPAVDQVNTAFTALQTATTGVTADNIRQKAPAIITALQQLGTATASLATMLAQKCPSG